MAGTEGEEERLLEWPLDERYAVNMPPGELLDSLFEAIDRCNRDPAYPLLILPPRDFGSVMIDRERRSVSAMCVTRLKSSLNND